MIIPSGPYKGSVDPYFANVSLLLHGNGANGGVLFPDSSSFGQSTSAGGTATTSTTQSKFNGSSIKVTSAGGFVNVANNTALNLDGAIDWTLEGWIYPDTAFSTYAGFITKREIGGDHGWSSLCDPTGHPAFYAFSQSIVAGSSSASVNAWNFLAFSYVSGTLNIYLAGTRIYSGAIANLTTNTFNMIIGAGRTDEYYFSGYMAEIRVTKGVGRYSGTTCPVPTAPFPNH